ncbi:MAG: group II intron maturase-specific domain-containing protein, partial [Planctomycetota bacterium]
MSKHRETIRQLTARDQVAKKAETVVAAINRVVRGYWNYYSLGTSKRLRWDLNQYARYSVTYYPSAS